MNRRIGRKAMKKLILILCSITVLVILCFCGSAFSGGGPDPTPLCKFPLPSPDSGKFIRGEFTAAVDKMCVEDEAHYDVHVILKMGSIRHLFSFIAPIGNENICEFEADTLKELFALEPCLLGIAGAFGLTGGMPVITSLTIQQQDFCDSTNHEEMIHGEVVIRVVPLE